MVPLEHRPLTRSPLTGLLERDRELDAIERALSRARAGAGGTVLIQAPAGAGCSSLLAVAADLAAAAGTRVLRAAGDPVSVGFPFGVALALLEPLRAAASMKVRQRLLAGPAAPAASLFDQIAETRDDDGVASFPLIHALTWIIRNHLTSEGDDGHGLAVIIDDAHWADAASLRWLVHLARQAPQLSLALVLGLRSTFAATDPAAVAGLQRAARGQLLTPGALSEAAVTRLAARRWSSVEPAFGVALAAATGGDPFLVTELLDEVAAQQMTPSERNVAPLQALVPQSVSDSVRDRLEALPQTARRVAGATAVLGDGASVADVARLAELDPRVVLEAADALAGLDVLRPGRPLGFAQPLVGSAVLSSLSSFARARSHLDAARLLGEQHADADQIARHLLLAPADVDPGAIAPLREAAHRALRRGDAERGVALLHRALQEHPALELRVDLLTELGRAESDAGFPEASSRLNEARRMSTDPERRADLALEQGQTLYATGRYQESADVLMDGHRELGETDPRLASEITGAFISAASIVDELAPRALELRAPFLTSLSSPPTPPERAAVAHTVMRDALQGTPRAEIRKLALLAWGQGALLRAGDALGLGPALLCVALVIADELELAIEIADETLADPGHRMRADRDETVSGIRAWARLEQGKLNEAEAEATAVLDGPAGTLPRLAHAMLALIACCHTERGRPEQAETILERFARHGMGDPMSHGMYLHVRALLRLVEYRPEEALTDALRAGELIEARFPNSSPGMVPWRSAAAEAYLALGQRDASRALAVEELARSRALGVTRIEIRDLRILGLSTPSKGLPRLAEAVRVGESYPERLEHARALVDFGAGLRRRNRRSDAREPLRRGLDLAHKGGAGRLMALARSELTATGARPRRPDSTGLDSLTVSQRRVAELAGRGLTTRQMAEALFVTPKTVEYHLRHIYQKLGIGSRDALRELLASAHAAGEAP